MVPISAEHEAGCFSLGQKSATMHRTCRAWMGARPPFQNTYHKGMCPFLGQSHCYVPDENREFASITSWSHIHRIAMSAPPQPSPMHQFPFLPCVSPRIQQTLLQVRKQFSLQNIVFATSPARLHSPPNPLKYILHWGPNSRR